MVVVEFSVLEKNGRHIVLFGDVHDEGSKCIEFASLILGFIRQPDTIAFIELGRYYISRYKEDRKMIESCLYYYIPMTLAHDKNCVINDIRCTNDKTPFISWKSCSKFPTKRTCVKWFDLDIIIKNIVANIGKCVITDNTFIERVILCLCGKLNNIWEHFKKEHDLIMDEHLHISIARNQDLRYNPKKETHVLLFQHIFDVGLLQDILPWYKTGVEKCCVLFVGSNHAEYMAKFLLNDQWVLKFNKTRNQKNLEEETSFFGLDK
jgi:hypothetical protein